MTKIILYGGAFDPKTIAHDAIVLAASKLPDYDQVWMQPCFNHMFAKQMSDPQLRLEMCRAGFNDPKIWVSDIEIKSQYSGGSYEFLQGLKSSYHSHEFAILIGEDNFGSIQKWKDYDKLIKEFEIIVIGRPGYTPLTTIAPKEFYKLRILPSIVERKISSTMFRNFMLAGDYEQAKTLVNPEVWAIITQRQIYRGAEQ